ncbi:hypothetical protein BC833DRAFT_238381 [Globomyces pollinis-pini]|nr:hypothetical protein BC833DRAFT_238381 [Globomyces pollinis-pini]
MPKMYIFGLHILLSTESSQTPPVLLIFLHMVVKSSPSLRYRVKKQRIWLYFTILNLFRLVVISIHIFYWYYIFEDWNTGYYVGFVYYSLSGLEYLFTVGLTAIQIFQLQVFKKYFWIKIGSLIILFILHVVLYGSNYFYICFSTEIQVCIPDTMYYEWGFLSPFWFITMFAWDLLPPILIPIALVQLSNRESLYKSLVTIFKLDRIYNITLIVHVWIIVIYFIIGMLSSSFIFQNDKVMFLMIHIRRTLVVVHEILTTVSVNQLKNIIPVLMNSAMGAASKQTCNKSEQPSAKSTIKSAPLHG